MITTKQFQILTDIDLIWNFMTETYDKNGGGIPAPFFEYALQSAWMNKNYQYLNRIWFDDDVVVGFVFNESPVTDIYFKIRSGYEFLSEEMIDYAIKNMPDFDGKQQLMLFNGQEELMEIAKKKGFSLLYDYEDGCFDFRNELNYELPDGYHFVDPLNADPVKLTRCLWYGFNHAEDKGEFTDWEREDIGDDWTPAKNYRNVQISILTPGPHATREFDVIIADENDNYVCYSGMWWVPENKLAYMEPLCTVPEHRNKGLAAAALSKHYHVFKEKGATHMTGGGDPFYQKIGYGKGYHWNCYGKLK